MNSITRNTFLGLLAILLLASGCAPKKQTTRQINNLQAQVGAISDEVARLDQALQETRAAIQSEENRRQELRSGVGASSSASTEASGVYRTPSGFELPSKQIQQALKNAGYYQGEIDGKIGSRSREAVKRFQSDNGLNADGVVGRQTWEKLKTYL